MWNRAPFGGPCMCNLFLRVLSGLEVRWQRISIAVGSVFLLRRPSAMPTIILSSMSLGRPTALGQQGSEVRSIICSYALDIGSNWSGFLVKW